MVGWGFRNRNLALSVWLGASPFRSRQALLPESQRERTSANRRSQFTDSLHFRLVCPYSYWRAAVGASSEARWARRHGGSRGIALGVLGDHPTHDGFELSACFADGDAVAFMLGIEVADPEVVAELEKHPEGPPRDRYALPAPCRSSSSRRLRTGATWYSILPSAAEQLRPPPFCLAGSDTASRSARITAPGTCATFTSWLPDASAATRRISSAFSNPSA